MLTSQTDIRSFRAFLIFFIVALLTVTIVISVYFSVRDKSVAKLEPYVVAFAVNNVRVGNELLIEYDYGYGFNPAHQRRFVVTSSSTPQMIDFTVSAWKKMNSLRISLLGSEFDGSETLFINDFSVMKGALEYRSKPEMTMTSDQPLNFQDVHTSLVTGGVNAQ